jgi:protein-S-isoprenylcysteine O-methyltransferase Ste14
MNTLFLVLLVLYVACLTTRSTYEVFKKAGRVDLKNKILFSLIFSVMCLMWVSWFTMCPLDPYAVNLPSAVPWIGLGMFLIGWGLALGALAQLRGLEDIDHLVTGGLFAKLRHPMYTGFILWIVGWAVYHGAAVSLLVGALGIANILYWRRLEDAAMESQWGDPYREYRKGTWF